MARFTVNLFFPKTRSRPRTRWLASEPEGRITRNACGIITSIRFSLPPGLLRIKGIRVPLSYPASRGFDGMSHPGSLPGWRLCRRPSGRLGLEYAIIGINHTANHVFIVTRIPTRYFTANQHHFRFRPLFRIRHCQSAKTNLSICHLSGQKGAGFRPASIRSYSFVSAFTTSLPVSWKDGLRHQAPIR